MNNLVADHRNRTNYIRKTKGEQTDDSQTKGESTEHGKRLYSADKPPRTHFGQCIHSNSGDRIHRIYEQWKQRKTGRERESGSMWVHLGVDTLSWSSSLSLIDWTPINMLNSTPPKKGGSICRRCTKITKITALKTLKKYVKITIAAISRHESRQSEEGDAQCAPFNVSVHSHRYIATQYIRITIHYTIWQLCFRTLFRWKYKW